MNPGEAEIKEYLQHLTCCGYAEGTITYRCIYLNRFIEYLKKNKIESITRGAVLNYQIHLSNLPFSGLTICSMNSVLRLFLTWLYDNGYLLTNPAKDISFPKRTIYFPKKILSELEVRRFLNMPDIRTKKGIRDKAILELFYSSGIRRAELFGLNLYDLNLQEETIRVLGKGQKERVVPVGRSALEWILKYIEKVRSFQNGRVSALFLDLVCRRRLSKSRINNIIQSYAKQLNLNKKITAHTFRHSCATHLLQNGADIRHIQEMLGHASPETTQIYARVAIKDLTEVYKKTHPRALKK